MCARENVCAKARERGMHAHVRKRETYASQRRLASATAAVNGDGRGLHNEGTYGVRVRVRVKVRVRVGLGLRLGLGSE